MTPGDIGPQGLKDPISLFIYLVETGGKVMVTSPDPIDAQGPLLRLGYEVAENYKDLRMLSAPAESFDAVWWTRANEKYSIEDLFRILQMMFKTLRPKKGILVLTFLKDAGKIAEKTTDKDPWTVRTVMTLFRQSGFQLFHSFESTDEHLFFCQRI